MHIPDGFLSPATCAALYGAAAPFWFTAMRRVKLALTSRLVPLLSVFSAFSFVIMMFNLPLPGGTTGHAVGVGIAAIVLGPWASMLAISVALLIQAVFFGDGGITTLGANCFNMAIAGSLAAYWVYIGLSGRAPLVSRRRVIAAAVAGYAAINVAALLAAIEFGLQWLWYRSPTGVPLYAPFPLHIAIPAMMIGHLTFAGLAELVVTGGVVAYLQRSDSKLLKATSRGGDAAAQEPLAPGWRATRPLWTGLAILMVLTPLGLLAAGSAWGEWRPQDFADPAMREQIKRSSGYAEPPAQAPARLEALSRIWTAPIPDYAPPFMRSAAFGYIMSSMVGVGLTILAILLLGKLGRK